jgi:hypothetical protein
MRAPVTGTGPEGTCGSCCVVWRRLTLDQVGERFGVGSAAAHAAMLAEGGQIWASERYWSNG